MKPEDAILISVDDHIAEPADMFDAHVPAKYKEHAPRVVEEQPGGVQQWWYGDVRGRNMGLNAVAGKPREMYNIDASRYDEMRPGCYDVHARVADMNAGGQLAGLNFPNFTGFSGQVLNQGPDQQINHVMIQAYNDWHVDQWCGEYPDRFIPCGILPLFDIELAAKEILRLADKGCHAVTFSERPEALGMPSIHSGEWDHLFATASDAETVLCCHIGSSSQPPNVAADAPAGIGMSLSSTASIHTFTNLVWATFWERFPNLKFSLTEGDVGWIPYFLWRSEHVHDRHSGWTKHTFANGGSPTTIFRDHILCCFINDPLSVELIEHFNIDNLCWESDYPHSDGTWPNAPEAFTTLVADLTDHQVARISHLNAMQHYKFDPFSIRPKEKCTAGALRAESPDVDTVTRVGRPSSQRDIDAWGEIQEALAAARR